MLLAVVNKYVEKEKIVLESDAVVELDSHPVVQPECNPVPVPEYCRMQYHTSSRKSKRKRSNSYVLPPLSLLEAEEKLSLEAEVNMATFEKEYKNHLKKHNFEEKVLEGAEKDVDDFLVDIYGREYHYDTKWTDMKVFPFYESKYKPNEIRRKEKLKGIPNMDELKVPLSSHESAVTYFELHHVLGDVVGSQCTGSYKQTKWGRNGKPKVVRCEGKVMKRKFKGVPQWHK